MSLRPAELLGRILVAVHQAGRGSRHILREFEEVEWLGTRDLLLACQYANHIRDGGAGIEAPAMQRAPGEPERLRLQPCHAVARRNRIQRPCRDARRDVEHHLILHEAGLAERRQVEAAAQIGGAARIALVPLVALIGLLALTPRGRWVLRWCWQRYRMERRNDWRLVQLWRRIRIEYARADHPAYDGDSNATDHVPDCFVIVTATGVAIVTARKVGRWCAHIL